MEVGFLVERSPAGKQVLGIWSIGVVPSGLSLRGPDMSLDMRLFVLSTREGGQICLNA